MRSNHELTWQPQRTKNNSNAGRWRKVYKSRFYYFPGGNGRGDERAYKEAQTAWKALKKKIDGAESSDRQLMDKALNWIVDQYVAAHPKLEEIQVA